MAIEPKADLQQFVHKHSPNTKIFSDVRTVVDDLERGSLKGETVHTDVVSGTMPCYAETSLAIYNNRETPHEDGDLFLNYQLRYVSATRPRVFFAEMTPPHAANGEVTSPRCEGTREIGIPSCSNRQTPFLLLW